jgi:DNA polymerase III epsilon subunit-like protein
MSKVLIFDVETTGLLPKKNSPESEYPYILQMSYIIYDLKELKILKTFDAYINIPKEVTIPEGASAVNGITREKCDGGIQMNEALMEFYEDMHTCQALIAHNFDFDSKVIQAEIKRNASLIEVSCPYADQLFDPDYLKWHEISTLCTMRISKNICRLPFKNPRPRDNYKFPTLKELYFHFFEEIPKCLHNSLMDVLVCLRCYLKIHLKYHLENTPFYNMVEKVFEEHEHEHET